MPTIRAKVEKAQSVFPCKPNRDDADGIKWPAISDGWLQKLQARHGLKLRGVQCEAASASKKVVEEGREALRTVTAQYIFNMEESTFSYCAVPATTVSKALISGRKAVKKRLTAALTTYEDSSSKVPLLFVGTSKQPCCFGNCSAALLGVDYTYSRKTWGTTGLNRALRFLPDYFNDKMRDENRRTYSFSRTMLRRAEFLSRSRTSLCTSYRLTRQLTSNSKTLKLSKRSRASSSTFERLALLTNSTSYWSAMAKSQARRS